MEISLNMAPRNRRWKICERCGTGMLRVGEGEAEECVNIWCQNRVLRLPQKCILPRFFIYSSKVCIIV